MFTYVSDKIDDDTLVEIYRGKYFDTKRTYRPKRVIALDFDETLGTFVDLEILWKTISLYANDSPPFQLNDLLDLYPEFLRYGILPILEYLYAKKLSSDCYKVYLYTNNQAHPSWVRLVVNYFNEKVSKQHPLFDQIVYAFKINNRRVELNRTSHDKIHSDFISCTLLPKRTAICFIDDTNYDNMKKERIYYIKPLAYRHSLSTNQIINRFLASTLGILLLTDVHHSGLLKEDYFNRCKGANVYRSATGIDSDIGKYDLHISRKIMFHLKEFFLMTHRNQQTKKRITSRSNFTRKMSTSTHF
jgi:hypothetical protein